MRAGSGPSTGCRRTCRTYTRWLARSGAPRRTRRLVHAARALRAAFDEVGTELPRGDLGHRDAHVAHPQYVRGPALLVGGEACAAMSSPSVVFWHGDLL